MADYKSAIKHVLLSEGGYVNDPTDAGGETYKGISRKNWPGWVGWLIIDSEKKKNNFHKVLNSNELLTESVIKFYKMYFWDKVGGDMIASQTIANLLVDSAVNEGVRPAVKRAQKIVLMAETGVISPELVEKLGALV